VSDGRDPGAGRGIVAGDRRASMRPMADHRWEIAVRRARPREEATMCCAHSGSASERGDDFTTGAGPDLMENAKDAAREMIDWLVADQGLSLHETDALCSVAGDFKISETVDLPSWLVSMTVPRGIFS
jgi:acetamidase/formamidase